MALCSYGNVINQKYNIHKENTMTAQQKKAEEAKALEEAGQAEETEDMHIVDAMKSAERGAKLARRGWDKSLNNYFVTIKRGESKPSLCTEKSSAMFIPSIEDVMTADWFNVEKVA